METKKITLNELRSIVKQIIKEESEVKKIEAKFWLVDYTDEPYPRVLRFSNLKDAKNAKSKILEYSDDYMAVPIFNSLKDLKYELDNNGIGGDYDVEKYRYMK
jgi:hypothetical protein